MRGPSAEALGHPGAQQLAEVAIAGVGREGGTGRRGPVRPGRPCCAATPEPAPGPHRRRPSRPRQASGWSARSSRTRSTRISLDLVVTARRGSAGRPRATWPTCSSTSGSVLVVRSAADDAGRRCRRALRGGPRCSATTPTCATRCRRPDALGRRTRRALLDGLLSGKTWRPRSRLVEQSLAGSYRTVSAAILGRTRRSRREVHGERVATVRGRPRTQRHRAGPAPGRP